ncbi:nuclear poly(A) polymerase 2-like [Camellia sinensis]|uniref:nuclear poly(A) polymerase 2-like n=1 Tax=Camellia sinensis TaxID=4442 RepID=UPI001036DBAB|nr:nuclear poly(A) polymerase 2-like [Camellia sinensis]XP_028096658.1 nuclear poly(A) polymerase 2-like [Camellia sinensis]XP_028096659.1 nuclear poly(A) polymerase 2-like [Camellia sinensis]
MKQLTHQRGYTDQIEDANAVIFTFGSYRLGHEVTLDEISTLCCLKDGYPCYGYNIVIFTLFILVSMIDILGDPNIQVLFQMH